jgi:predicted GNAT family N-acyltransferase
MESVEFFPIEIEQTSWSASSNTLSKLRQQVFVKEQGVPEDEEFDSADTDAVHWLAYAPKGKGNQVPGPEDVIGCARLCGNKVGRMAVSYTHRNRGVGSALLRRIIAYAARNGIESLQLNAQTHAVEFYQGMYFEADGEEFIEAGIPHRHMTLSLKRFTHPKIAPLLPDVAEEERERITVDSAQSFNEQAKKLVRRAERKIRIFSKDLDPRIYDDEEFYRLMFDFARAHPYAEIHILVKNPRLLVQNGHRLLRLYHHLPSRVQMKSLNSTIKTLHTEFLLIDHNSILYNQSSDRYTGYVVYHSPLEAVELADSFDSMWERSEFDPELRRLPI